MARYFSALFCGISFLLSQTYILSYKAQVKDSELIHQSLYASKSMTPHSLHKQWTKSINLLKACQQQDFFSCYQEELIDMLYQHEVSVQSISKKDSFNIHSFSEVNVAPTYFEVNFYDSFVKISLLK